MTDLARRATRRYLRRRAAACLCCGLLLASAAVAAATDDGQRVADQRDDIEDHARLGRDDSPRSVQDLARDAGEQPAVIARMAGAAPQKRVADLRAGDGYLTEVLALAVYPYGKVFANNDPAGLDPGEAQAWRVRLDKPVMADTERLDRPLADPLPAYAVGLDAVVAAGAFGDAAKRDVDRPSMHAAVLRALAPGGLYVIVNARAAAGADTAEAAALCRADEAAVRKEVEAAGFRFVAASQALAEPSDPHTTNACAGAAEPGPHPLDRFALQFEKPQLEPQPPAAAQ